MATRTAGSSQRVSGVITRQRVMGIVFLVVAFGIWFFFLQSLDTGVTTTFGLAPGGAGVQRVNWEFGSWPMVVFLAITAAVLGGVQLVRGFGNRTNLVLGLVVMLFVLAFLTWGASGRSLNVGGLLNAALVRSVPITLGAFSGILSERAGVVNIAIEGMMLMAAMVGAIAGSLGGMWVGLIAAIAAGALMGLLHAVLSIHYKMNQIISGTVINIFSAGFTSYMSTKFLQTYTELNTPQAFPSWKIPGLFNIPIVGPILFNNNIFVYGMLVMAFVLYFVLFHTRWGLRVRAVGEHPKAADTLGINVFRIRYISVMLSGAMAGFGGAYFTLGSVPRFDELLTAGRGFIGLAAMIFGNWKPFGSMGAGLLFGFADSLQTKLAILGLNIPSEFLLMIPYVVTMVALAGVVGRGHMPAADGQPYEKEGA